MRVTSLGHGREVDRRCAVERGKGPLVPVGSAGKTQVAVFAVEGNLGRVAPGGRLGERFEEGDHPSRVAGKRLHQKEHSVGRGVADPLQGKAGRGQIDAFRKPRQ